MKHLELLELALALTQPALAELRPLDIDPELAEDVRELADALLAAVSFYRSHLAARPSN